MTDRLQFGVNVNTRWPVIFASETAGREMIDFAEAVDRDPAYDYVAAGDNFLSTPRYECLTTMAAVAARTRRARLVTACLISPLRQAAWLALSWATIDQLSGGRTVLNLCVGGVRAGSSGVPFEVQYRAVGVPHTRRGEVLEDQIVFLRKAWTQDVVSHKSDFIDLENVPLAPKPLQQPCPPIWVSNNPHRFGFERPSIVRAMRRIARLADGWMTAAADADEYRRGWDMVRRLADEEGRDWRTILPSYQMTVTVAPDRAAARREANDFLNRYYLTSFADLDESYWAKDAYGTPDEVIARLRAQQEAGCRLVCLRFAARDQMEQLDRFSRLVAPAFG